MNLTPTEEQRAIIDAVSSGHSLKVAALAGTGKTSTLQLIASTYPERRGLYLAYNKALQLAAQDRFPPWIDCKTVHGLAFKKEGFKFFKQLKERPNYDEIIDALTIEDFEVSVPVGTGKVMVELGAEKQVSLSREIIRYFTFSNQKTIDRQNFEGFLEKELSALFPDFYQDGVLKRDDVTTVACFETLVQKILTETQKIWEQQCSCESDTVPATHDTYLKTYQMSKPSITGYDYIMLDEAQDANPCILDILANQNCQVIYVGDEHQQIYEFRGTVNAMQTLELPVLYLTQSFRFGKKIAAEANAMLKQLKSPSLVKGLSSIPSMVGEITQLPYTFLARTNITLFEKCAEAIKAGHKCSLAADVKSIISLVRSVFYIWMKKPEWVKDERVEAFITWQDLLEFADDEDDHEILGAINFVRKFEGDTLDLLNLIAASGKIPESRADIFFSTVHRAKGREWDRVVIADDFNLKTQQEINLYYVAITRCKHLLQHTWPKSTK
jgi:superfamily I DNA/RNA helicase